jgi:L-threonylcarbamoyladenylate synthase
LTSSEIEAAAVALRAGKLVVLPTDTVYGLGALPNVHAAIERIYLAKGRPESKPIPVLGASLDDLRSVAVFGERPRALADRHWPGPLTLVLPRAEGFTADLGGDQPEGVAVRVPACDPALALLRQVGPLAVTSANRSGEAPATTVAEARAVLDEWADAFIDGGRCDGEPSTVISLLGEPTVLRPGPVSLSLRLGI